MFSDADDADALISEKERDPKGSDPHHLADLASCSQNFGIHVTRVYEICSC